MIIALCLQTLHMISKKPALLLLAFFATFTLCCKQQPVFSQKQDQKQYDLVKDFKAVPDDKTDNYLAFAMAAEVLSKAGGGLLNIPKGKYYIAGYKGQAANKLYTAADIVFQNCNGLTIIGNNSTIRVNGNFTRSEDYQLGGFSHFYASNNTVCPIKLMNCKNVLLKDITIYGEVDKMKRQGRVVEGECYGVFISDDDEKAVSSNIRLENVNTHHFAADGILIRSNGENIVLDNCTSSFNARQGLSIVKGKNIKVLNSSFDSTGNTGAYGWHAPGAGIDIENEYGLGKLNDVLIRNCNLRGNNGFQIVTTLPSQRVAIDSCFISDLTAGYSSALNGVGMYSLNSSLTNSILFASIQVDLGDQFYTGPLIQEINKNIIYSGHRAIVSADYSRPVNITDNLLIMLPTPQLNEYFPYIQNNNCRFNRNIVVVHADRIKKEPNQVTALVQSSMESKEDFWLVNGYDVPVNEQSQYYFLTAMNGTKLVKDHFFGASSVVSRYDFTKTHFLSTQQVNDILKRPLFSAYKQQALNRNFLQQANEVRSFTRNIVMAAQQK